MAEEKNDRIVIRHEDLKWTTQAQPRATLGKQAEGKRRLLLITGAAAAGLVLLVLIGVAVLHRTPNYRCWRQLRAAVIVLPKDPSPGHVIVALRRLEEVDLGSVTDGDLVEAHRLSVEVLKYLRDYPSAWEAFKKGFKAGASLDLEEIIRIVEGAVTMPEKTERWGDLLEKLERKYGG